MSSFGFFLKITFFGIIISEMPSVCQRVWIQVRPKDLPGLQTACKGYQQTALVGKELKIVGEYVETHNEIICIVYCNTRIKSHHLIRDAQIKLAYI